MKTAKVPKAKPVAGFAHFQKARKTTEELYNEINGSANITVRLGFIACFVSNNNQPFKSNQVNSWMMLVGASIMAAGGLASNATVFIVAAMLVSPIMGPILGTLYI
jgi:hypothetical protein